MTDETNLNTTITIDMKRFRIRIHMSTFNILGVPEYIQFLVNPDDMAIALNFVDRKEVGDEAHKVNINRVNSGNSYEVYSRTLVTKLSEVAGLSGECCNYRLSGKVMPAQHMAVFSLKTLMKIES